MLTYIISSLLAAFLLALPASAQTGRAPMRAMTSVTFDHGQHARFPRSLYLGSSFWADDYFSPAQPAPSVIVIQTQPAPAERSSALEQPKSAAPLLIEWQGDRYVRRTTVAANDARAAQPDYVATAATLSSTPRADAITSARPEPPPTAFVFRDGHREESSDYSIISGVIYARGDYWATGSWSKQIPLAQLDLPATLKANHERNAPFRLPTAPNEVVTRP